MESKSCKTIGHDAIRDRFRRTIERGRLASTYLFVGPAGVGKRTFAMELAGALLCSNLSSAAQLCSCGACESCRLLAGGSHPDLIAVEKPPGKATLPIELFVGRADHRNQEGLCHDIAMKPYLGSRRIAVVDDADDLSVESANSLLKTLEEPPPRSLLILIGTSLSKQLPTIRSRSQVIRFHRLSTGELTRVLTERNLVGEEQDPAQLAESGEGSVSAALEAGDAQLIAFRQELAKVLARGQFDPIRLAVAVNEQTAAAGTEPAARRNRLRKIIDCAIDQYRDALRGEAAAGGVDPQLLERLDRSLDAAEAVGKNANQATLIQSWLTSIAR